MQIKISPTAHIRLIASTDAPRIFYLVDKNRAYLREWLPWVDGTQVEEDTINFIQFSLVQHEKGKQVPMVVVSDGELVGLIGLNEMHLAYGHAHIGYWLSEECQGKGLMTLSTIAMLNYAFSVLNLNRVEIRCAPRNLSSRAIPERLGLFREGTLRQIERLYDRYVDLIVYSILREEWLKKEWRVDVK